MKRIDEVLADSGPKCEVRNEVGKHLDRIAEFQSAGCSNKAIYRALMAEGHQIGSVSGFNNALRYFRSELERLNSIKRTDDVSAPTFEPATPMAPEAVEMSCIDDRNPNQVGRS
jgi:hypothetical protein